MILENNNTNQNTIKKDDDRMEKLLEGFIKTYEVKNELKGQDDNDILNEFIANGYASDNYIGDLIQDISDSEVGIYTHDILDQAKGLYMSGAYEEASANGLLEGANDLIYHLQMAWHEYNSMVLYDNLELLVFNYAIDRLQNDIIDIDDIIDVNKFINDLEGELLNIDNNNTLQDIDDVIIELLNGQILENSTNE